jgi:hypothetical protein
MPLSQKKFIVITSIFSPSEAIKKFSKIEGWRVIVVGDKKTQGDWQCENVTYLSPKKQQQLGFEIVKHLPWNHYSRKMIGYLYAIKEGADVIYDTDDDNIPLQHWYQPEFIGNHKTLSGISFVNIYSYFTDKKVWPRGLPLQKILNTKKAKEKNKKNSLGIWQFLANNDPDVDAIYRLTDNTPIIFNDGPLVVLEKNTIAPINTQNTFFHKKAFPLLFLPAFVTFRFTDILRGFVAQPILWTKNSRAGFGGATVVQKRNIHDYHQDFESEIPMHLHTKTVIQTAKQTADPQLSYADNLINIYTELQKLSIVTKKELRLLMAWCNDIKKIS